MKGSACIALLLAVLAATGCAASRPEGTATGRTSATAGESAPDRERAGIYLRLARIYLEEMKDPGRAAEYYRRYLSVVPEGKDADLARAKLRELESGSEVGK